MAKDGDMKGASNKRLVPELRFPDFEKEGEWKNIKLENIAEFYKGKGISKNDISNNGKTPCIRYGELYTFYKEIVRKVKSYTNLPIENLFFSKVNDVIIPSSGETKEDISTASCILCDNIALGGDINVIRASRHNGVFLSYYLNNAKNNDIAQIAQGVSIIHLHNSQLQKLLITIPSADEQQKIAECLSSIDEEINAIKEKVEQLKVHKKGLLQKLFPVVGQFVPELRFQEFKKDWDVDSMQSMFDMKNGYTPSKSNPTYWDNGTIPWFRMEDIRKNGHILSDSIQHVTQQAVKNSGLFPAYSIIVATTATIGEHALIIVDSLANQQFTFLTKRKSFKDKINMMYFHHYMFIIDEWCKKNTNSGGLVSVNMPAFKQLLISFPCPAEQQKIAECLSSIDELISLYENKVILLEQHKKGLMQQLFPKMTKS